MLRHWIELTRGFQTSFGIQPDKRRPTIMYRVRLKGGQDASTKFLTAINPCIKREIM